MWGPNWFSATWQVVSLLQHQFDSLKEEEKVACNQSGWRTTQHTQVVLLTLQIQRCEDRIAFQRLGQLSRSFSTNVIHWNKTKSVPYDQDEHAKNNRCTTAHLINPAMWGPSCVPAPRPVVLLLQHQFYSLETKNVCIWSRGRQTNKIISHYNLLTTKIQRCEDRMAFHCLDQSFRSFCTDAVPWKQNKMFAYMDGSIWRNTDTKQKQCMYHHSP